jgi:hypothetical protein
MRACGYLVLLMMTMVGGDSAAQTPAAEAAVPVLAATRVALGGEKKLAAVTSVTATGRTRQVRGDNLVPIEFELVIQLPDQYVRRDEVPAQESAPTLLGFVGDELLQFPPAAPPGQGRPGGPPPPTAEQLAAGRVARLAGVKQDFARLALGMFAASFDAYPLTFSYVGKAEAPQGKADVLDVRGPAGPGAFSGRLFVHADTHLPLMVTWQAPAPQRGGPPRGGPPSLGGPPPPPPLGPPAAANPAPGSPSQGPPPAPPESRLYFADYRDVNGIQLPFRLRRAVGPDTIEETTFDGFKINAKVDPKKFELKK